MLGSNLEFKFYKAQCDLMHIVVHTLDDNSVCLIYLSAKIRILKFWACESSAMNAHV